MIFSPSGDGSTDPTDGHDLRIERTFDLEMLKSHEGGWNGVLDHLGAYLAED